MVVESDETTALDFLSVLANPSEEIFCRVAIADMTWSFPGRSRISGEAQGMAGIMRRAQVIAEHAVKVEFVDTVFGFPGLAMILHNTSRHEDRFLDQHVVAVFTFRQDKIARLDTYVSDVGMMEHFFA